MSQYVVDASVAVKWFVPEIHAESARRLLGKDIILLAPDLIWAEVGNVLWRKWREGELAAEDAQAILGDFRRFPLRIRSSESLYAVTWPIAQDSGRTFYDCLYLALAVGIACPLVTADRRFFNALANSPWRDRCMWVEDIPRNS